MAGDGYKQVNTDTGQGDLLAVEHDPLQGWRAVCRAWSGHGVRLVASVRCESKQAAQEALARLRRLLVKRQGPVEPVLLAWMKGDEE